MAIINPPAWIQQGSYPARTDRLVMSSLVWQQGVVEGLDVSQTSGVSMGVRVNAGKAFIQGTSASLQGMYNVINDAFTTIPLEGSDPTFTRYDLIVLRILDADVAGSANEARLERITGTASSSPQVPTAPASSLVLARITVGAGVSTIANASITDTRLFTAAGGGIVWLPNEAARLRLGNPPAGRVYYIHQADTGVLWKNTGTSWALVVESTAPVTVNPTGNTGWDLSGVYISKNVGFLVYDGSIRTTGATVTLTTTLTEVGSAPVGYRPARTMRTTVQGSGSLLQYEAIFYGDGRIAIRALSGGTAPSINATSLYNLDGTTFISA